MPGKCRFFRDLALVVFLLIESRAVCKNDDELSFHEFRNLYLTLTIAFSAVTGDELYNEILSFCRIIVAVDL